MRLRDAEPHVVGLDAVRAAVTAFAPEKVADACGIDAATIRRIARELVAAPTAVVYGRIGTTTTEFGTTASWLVDVLNTLTGNLDRRGGVMFTKPAAGSPNTQGPPGIGRGTRIPGSKRTRVRGLPSALGEMPTSAMAEEIDTPSEDGTRVRALITVAGNPALSSPNAARLEKALESLDFMVSVDIYLNETTRHADVILPAPSTLTRTHYDISFTALACRNVVRFSPATLPAADGERPSRRRCFGSPPSRSATACPPRHWTTWSQPSWPVVWSRTRSRGSRVESPRSCWPLPRRCVSRIGCST